jgi:hypothetical protein
MHLGPLFFEKHLALDHFVVCAYAPGFAVGHQRGRVSFVKDEQELVWHFLFDLDHFVVAHKVEFGRLFGGGSSGGYALWGREIFDRPLLPLAETRCLVGLIASL